MTTAMTENRKRDARSEGDPAQTSGSPAIRGPTHSDNKTEMRFVARKEREAMGRRSVEPAALIRH